MYKEVSSKSISPVTWMYKNLGTINRIVYERATIVEMNIQRYRIQNFGVSGEPHLRLRITEGGICKTWKWIGEELALPEGFSIAEGLVITKDNVMEHTYLQSGTGPDRTIFCFSAPQFMPGEEKGEKIQELKKRASLGNMPELVQTIGNFTVVYGKASDIQNILGMSYIE